MRSCQACNIELPEEGVFCPSCGNQIGCKSCPATLTPGARFCAQCGAAVEKVSESQTNGHAANNSEAGFNVIEIERGASRLKAKLSDPAVDSLSKPLTIYMAAAAGVAVKRGKRGGLPDIELDDEQQPMLPGIAGQNGHQDAAAKVIEATVTRKGLSGATPEEVVSQRLREIFRERDGTLRLEEPDLKASGKLDYAQRLTYLFLLAHVKPDSDLVPRSALNAALERATVYDPHASTWIKNESRIVKDGDNVHLNAGGRRQALKYLDEIFTITEEGWLPGESGAGAGKPAGDKGGKQAAKQGKGRGGRKSEATTTFLPKWKSLNLVSNGYSLLKDRTLAEKGIFGLWAIRKAVGDAGKIISESVLASFLYQAFEIQVDKRGLGRALLAESKKKEKRVLHMGGTKFQVTPDGMAAAEKMAGLTKGKK